jgi:hypothetical protein
MSVSSEQGAKGVAQNIPLEVHQPSMSSCVEQALNEASGIVYMCQDDCIEAGVLIDDSEPLQGIDLVALAIRVKDELEHRPREYDEVARIACDLLMLALYHEKASARSHELFFAQLSRLSAELCDAGLLQKNWRQWIEPLAALTLPEIDNADVVAKPEHVVPRSGTEKQIHRVRIPAYVDTRCQAFLPTMVLNLPMGENGEPVDSDWNYIEGWSDPVKPSHDLHAASCAKYTVHVEFRVAGWDQGWQE